MNEDKSEVKFVGILERVRIAVCRLCLKECEDSDVVEVTKFTKDVVEVLFLKLNLDITLNPVICETCSTNLKQFFNFKCTCLYTEDSITPYIETRENNLVNLYDVYVRLKDSEISPSISDEQKVCRLCMKLAWNGTLALNATDEDSSSVTQFIQAHLPELNLSATKDPVICYTCYQSIVSHSRFVSDCLAVERKIEDFHKTRNNCDNSVLTLSSVLQYMKKTKRREGNRDTGLELDETNSEASSILKERENEKDVTNVPKKFKSKSSSRNKGKIRSEANAEGLPQLSVAPTCKSCRGKAEEGAVFHDLPFDTNSTISLLGCQDCIDFADITQLIKKSFLTYGYINSRSYYCRLCGTKSTYRIQYKLHILRHKYRMKAIYKCDLCEFVTNVACCLHGHLKQHRVPIKCDYCAFSTKFSSGLYKHLKKLHSNSAANDVSE